MTFLHALVMIYLTIGIANSVTMLLMARFVDSEPHPRDSFKMKVTRDRSSRLRAMKEASLVKFYLGLLAMVLAWLPMTIWARWIVLGKTNA